MCGYYSFVAVRKLQLTGSITRQDVHDRLVTYFTSMQNTPYEVCSGPCVLRHP